MMQIHPQARTTPAVRAEIAGSTEPTSVVAKRYGISGETVRVWTPRWIQGGVREICSRRFRCFRVSGLLMQPSSRLLACMEIADRVQPASARSRRLDIPLVFPTPSSDRCAIPLY